jgi:hypothetical protein
MANFVQLLLAVVISTLTFLVTFAAIQVFQILYEFRQSLKKLNQILDNTQTLSEGAAKPISAVNEFFSEVKDLVDDTQEELIADTPDRVVPQKERRPRLQLKEAGRRFFHRSGAPLRPS